MTNRTIQFLGQGYAPVGTEPIVITATLNGNVVYTGNIPTAYTSNVSTTPADQVVLFSFEVPMAFAGTQPMAISIDNPVGVIAYFEQIYSNYMKTLNPVYTQNEIGVLTNPASTQAERIAIYTANAVPPLSAAEIAILENGTPTEKTAVLASHNLTVIISFGPDTFVNLNGPNEPRSNVVVNGVAKTRGDTPTGTWGWIVEFPAEGSGLLEYDLTATAGLE
jgi:hypothetical protein